MQPSVEGARAVDEYIAAFPDEIRALLQQVRDTLHAAAPDATERLAYGMPTLYLGGNLVHFAAFKEHIGFYPTPSAITQFSAELAPYASSKGAVRFPIAQPLPFDLIAAITRWRAAENRERAATRLRRPAQPAPSGDDA